MAKLTAPPAPPASVEPEAALVPAASQPAPLAVAPPDLEAFGDGAALMVQALDGLASAGLDLANPEGLNGAAEAAGQAVPWIRVLQKANDEHPELHVGLYTNAVTLEQHDELRVVVLASKFQRQNRSKYVPGADQQRPTICWSKDGRHACGGSRFDEGGELAGRQPAQTSCASCPHNRWRPDSDTGKRAKTCDDVYLLLLGVLGDEGAVEPGVYMARGSAVKPTKKLIQQLGPLSLRHGRHVPARVAGLRKLAVAVTATVEHVTRPTDFYRPRFVPSAAPREVFPDLVATLHGAYELFANSVHVDMAPTDDADADEERGAERRSYRPSGYNEEPPPPDDRNMPSNWQGDDDFLPF